MKNVNTFIAIALIAFSCSSDKKETSKQEELIEVTTTETLYGESFDQKSISPISELENLMAESDSIPLIMSGTIEKTCVNKGCWMQLSTSNEPVRVTFKDYGFFVPKSGMEGKQAVVNGYCVRKESSVEELQHYAKDAGQSESEIALITEAKTEYSFVASGVYIQ